MTFDYEIILLNTPRPLKSPSLTHTCETWLFEIKVYKKRYVCFILETIFIPVNNKSKPFLKPKSSPNFKQNKKSSFTTAALQHSTIIYNFA